MLEHEKYGSLRSHQRDAVDVAIRVLKGEVQDRVIVAGVTPGGGKTLMAALFADILFDAEFIEQVIVVVPNKPLARQMRDGFNAPDRGLNRYLGDRASKGGKLLPGMSRPCGRVYTYQYIAANPDELLRRAKKKATLLILDEPHHLSENRAWSKAIEPVVSASKLVLMMSGTLSRGDGEPIPFVTYVDGVAKKHIEYSRLAALGERAILSISVKRYDGDSFYEHRGEERRHALSTAPKKEQARALKTALLTHEFVDHIVIDALRDWSQYRREKYASKAIVVAHTQRAARRLAALISRNFPEAHAVLAVCDEPTADQAIHDFRSGRANVLVTVRKAYEGLDVKSATHLVYLGDARTFGFLDQVIARVTRVNGESCLSWEEQEARIFVPDDAKSRAYLDRLLEEQSDSFDQKGETPGVGAARPHSTFKPEYLRSKLEGA